MGVEPTASLSLNQCGLPIAYTAMYLSLFRFRMHHPPRLQTFIPLCLCEEAYITSHAIKIGYTYPCTSNYHSCQNRGQAYPTLSSTDGSRTRSIAESKSTWSTNCLPCHMTPFLHKLECVIGLAHLWTGRVLPYHFFKVAPLGVEPRASLVLSECGLPIAYGAM